MDENLVTEANKNAEPKYNAYVVQERGAKKFWTKVGACFEHGDGKGITVEAAAWPAQGGTLVLRVPKQAEAV